MKEKNHKQNINSFMSMNVLISIKPKYVKKIEKGEKRYEFRKSIFNCKKINFIYIYCTTPIKKLVARFKIKKIIEDTPLNLWEKYRFFAGINKNEFFNYFEGKIKGYAIKIKDLEFFKNSVDPYQIWSDFIPPQSFRYIEDIPYTFDIVKSNENNNLEIKKA